MSPVGDSGTTGTVVELSKPLMKSPLASVTVYTFVMENGTVPTLMEAVLKLVCPTIPKFMLPENKSCSVPNCAFVVSIKVVKPTVALLKLKLAGLTSKPCSKVWNKGLMAVNPVSPTAMVSVPVDPLWLWMEKPKKSMAGYGFPLLGLFELVTLESVKPPVVPVGETVKVARRSVLKLGSNKIWEPDVVAPPDVVTVCVVASIVVAAPLKLYWDMRFAKAGGVARTVMNPTASQINFMMACPSQ
jgi:hypothetical protein